MALTSIGLLFLGSTHGLKTEFLLSQIGTKPSHGTDPRQVSTSLSSTDDADSYSLCAGIGLGMVTLGRGGTFGDMDVEVGGDCVEVDVDVCLLCVAQCPGEAIRLQQLPTAPLASAPPSSVCTR